MKIPIVKAHEKAVAQRGAQPAVYDVCFRCAEARGRGMAGVTLRGAQSSVALRFLSRAAARPQNPVANCRGGYRAKTPHSIHRNPGLAHARTKAKAVCSRWRHSLLPTIHSANLRPGCVPLHAYARSTSMSPARLAAATPPAAYEANNCNCFSCVARWSALRQEMADGEAC